MKSDFELEIVDFAGTKNYFTITKMSASKLYFLLFVGLEIIEMKTAFCKWPKILSTNYDLKCPDSESNKDLFSWVTSDPINFLYDLTYLCISTFINYA